MRRALGVPMLGLQKQTKSLQVHGRDSIRPAVGKEMSLRHSPGRHGSGHDQDFGGFDDRDRRAAGLQPQILNGILGHDRYDLVSPQNDAG